MKTLEELVLYLREYDKPFERVENTEESREVIIYLYRALRNLPDVNYRVTGPYQLNARGTQEYELFYIKDMMTFKMLLDEKRYYSFIHELFDFLDVKVLRKEDKKTRYLPQNIKYALLYVLETSFLEL